MFLAAKQDVKFLDWLGRMSGSTAGSSALVRDERDKKQRGLIGEVQSQICFNQEWIRSGRETAKELNGRE